MKKNLATPSWYTLTVRLSNERIPFPLPLPSGGYECGKWNHQRPCLLGIDSADRINLLSISLPIIVFMFLHYCVVCRTSQVNHTSAIISASATALDVFTITSCPCQNFGSWSPGTKRRSTPLSVITHIRITPPDEPSRAMARDRATRHSAEYEAGNRV